MDQELLDRIKHKKDVQRIWKQDRLSGRNTGIPECREDVRNARVHLALNLARDMKGKKNGISIFSSSNLKRAQSWIAPP